MNGLAIFLMILICTATGIGGFFMGVHFGKTMVEVDDDYDL